jgi:hypothetical protein
MGAQYSRDGKDLGGMDVMYGCRAVWEVVVRTDPDDRKL